MIDPAAVAKRRRKTRQWGTSPFAVARAAGRLLQAVERALDASGGAVYGPDGAAAALGVTPQNLYTWGRAHGVDVAELARAARARRARA